MSLEHLINQIKKNNFLLIGRAGIDIYPDPPGTKIENAEKFISHLGGSSANVAVELTKLGGNCNLLTRVSDDALGRLTLNQLKRYNINTPLIELEKNEARISLAIVESRIKDHQSIIYRHHAADLYLSKEDIVKAQIEKFACILITGTAFAAEPSRSSLFMALEIANKNNIPVIMDIDYRPYTWESQIIAKEIYNKASEKCSGIIGNDDEFAVLSGDYSKGLNFAKNLSSICDLVIYKKGEKGSITFTETNEIKKGIFSVKPIKPTGAGDAFMGALIGALLKNYDIKNSIEIGSAAAAIVVTKVGCAPAMPDLEQILEFIKINNIN